MNEKEKIIENLADSGCDSCFIADFMQTSELRKQLKMLEKHREKLLDIYHKDAKKLDCLDYLIYHIKKSERNL